MGRQQKIQKVMQVVRQAEQNMQQVQTTQSLLCQQAGQWLQQLQSQMRAQSGVIETLRLASRLLQDVEHQSNMEESAEKKLKQAQQQLLQAQKALQQAQQEAGFPPVH